MSAPRVNITLRNKQNCLFGNTFSQKGQKYALWMNLCSDRFLHVFVSSCRTRVLPPIYRSSFRVSILGWSLEEDCKTHYLFTFEVIGCQLGEDAVNPRKNRKFYMYPKSPAYNSLGYQPPAPVAIQPTNDLTRIAVGLT